jgi:hypothetical protein
MVHTIIRTTIGQYYVNNPRSRGESEPHDFCLGGERSYEMRLHGAMRLSGGGDRMGTRAITVQQMPPVAHGPLVLGVLRRLEGATVLDRLRLPHPAHGLSCGRGAKPWSSLCSLAILPSRRWGDGGKNVAWGPCCSLSSPVPHSRMTGWGPSSMRCVPPSSTAS